MREDRDRKLNSLEKDEKSEMDVAVQVNELLQRVVEEAQISDRKP